ncbi:hypothetical protein EON83_20305 [bacterium]|nr:MAG: hypothetical protein EON83_20305 [bacterium]
MNDDLLKALFAWCLENHLPEIKAFTTKEGDVALYVWRLKRGENYLEVWLDPDKWLLTCENSWDEWDYDCNAMGRPSSGYSVKVESVAQLQSALMGAFHL